MVRKVLRKDAQTARQQISELLQDGTSAKDIAEIVDCSVPFIYLVAREIGYTFERGSKLDDKVSDIRKEIDGGATFAELSRKFGVSKHTIINFCKAKGIENKKQHDRFVDSIPSIVDTNTSLRFEYVDGYTNNRGTIRCRCRFCGRVSELTWQSIAKGSASCPLCAEDEKNRIEEIKCQDLLLKQEQKRIEQEHLRVEREQQKARQKEEQYNKKLHPCVVCGEVTDRPKYCSDRCSNKASNKANEIRRRNIIKEAMIDNDITLQSLYKRDGGVCYLCGKPCRYDDYVTKDGTFIAGDWYPSIDHVIALANGGEHSWENVRLAHRLCNSRKSDRGIPPPY